MPGALELLAVGNRARLLDVRRTPVRVTAVLPERGAFEIEVEAFEDAGAQWELSLSQVGRFQFARDGARVTANAAAALRRAQERFAGEVLVERQQGAAAGTRAAISAARARAGELLDARPPAPGGLAAWIAGRRGDVEVAQTLERFLSERDLVELDREFAERLVSNPASGEIVKGHAIVVAELGLCAYRGEAPRDPLLFEGGWRRERRAAHVIARMSFAQELWSRLGAEKVELYRAAATEGQLNEPGPASFVSATFSREVAEAHFAGGPATRLAVLWRQWVPLHRLFMTFVETAAFNQRFLEAEAVLIGDPGNRAF